MSGPALNAAVGAPMVDHVVVRYGTERYWRALKDVRDPELPISVVDMGLIYDVRLEGRTAEVTLTYTATGCPCVDFIRTDITDRLLAEPDVDAVTLHEVWSPPWTRAMMTEEGRAALRKLGVAA